MHFKFINVDGIALERLFKTFFLFHVVKVCEKEVFHFRKLKVSKNCLFAKKYAPVFLKKHLQESLTAQNNSGSWFFFVFASTFECAPKVISTEAAFFAKRLGIEFTLQIDVGSRWGKKLGKLECYQWFVEPNWQFYWNFLPRVKPPLSQTQRILWENNNLLIVFKTFLTNTAALPKCRKHERSFRRELRKKTW